MSDQVSEVKCRRKGWIKVRFSGLYLIVVVESQFESQFMIWMFGVHSQVGSWVRVRSQIRILGQSQGELRLGVELGSRLDLWFG